MIAADIEDAVAAQEIEVSGVIHVVEISALRARIDLVETDDALRRDERAIEVPLVQLVVFAEPRRDDFFQIKSHREAWPEGGRKANEPAAGATRPRAGKTSADKRSSRAMES